MTASDDLEDGTAVKLWDCPVTSVAAAYYSLALAAGDQGLFRFDLSSYHQSNGDYEPSEMTARHCSDCHWMSFSVLGSSHVSGAVLAELAWEEHATPAQPEVRLAG